MTSVEKKLLSLNLALLFLFLCAHPAFAAGTEHAEEFLQSEASVAMGETLQRQEQNEAATQSLSEEEPYSIRVGDTSFLSNQNMSGKNWEYNSERHRLKLTGYKGGGIAASGDLAIYTYRDVAIIGRDGDDYGEDGIAVSGNLELGILGDGQLEISGGSGSERGGNAIYGGESVDIYGSSFTATGGTSSHVGGCGIFSDSVYVDANGTLSGGTGAYGGAGVFFYSDCYFSLVNATILGGDGEESYAIASEEGRDWQFHKHVTAQISKNQQKVILRVNAYTLRLLDGNQTIMTTKAEFPTRYDLIDFHQEKDGFEQIGWEYHSAEGNTLLPVNAMLRPTTNVDLYAYWESVGAEDILLQGFDGYFENGTIYQKETGKKVVLPERLSYRKDNNLLAWSDQLEVSQLALNIYAGTWYCGGDTIDPDANAAKVLYACPQNGAGTAIYHPTNGTVTNGGTVVVQGRYVATASPIDLQTYVLDESYFTAPDGYELAGWSTSPEAKDIDYTPHQKLTVKEETIQHLYAVWKGKEYTETPEQGCTVTTIPAEAKVEVTLEKSWCIEKGVKQGFCALYDENGKLIDVSFGTQNDDQGITLEMQYMGETAKTCKVFGVKDQNIPTGQAIECTLPATE